MEREPKPTSDTDYLSDDELEGLSNEHGYEPADVDDTPDVEPEPEPEERMVPQSKLDEAISKRLARERRNQEKTYEKLFGTKNLEEAAEYYQAGRVVSQASRKPPREVVEKLSGQVQQQGQPGYTQNDPIRKELEEMKSLLVETKQQEIREKQESQARKEFGRHFDEYRVDIEDYAEDHDLSLDDAAAVVLRPKMREIFEEQARNKQQVKRRKKVDTTDGAPDSGGPDVSTALSPSQKRVAQRMGLSYKDYYQQLKELGEIEE